MGQSHGLQIFQCKIFDCSKNIQHKATGVHGNTPGGSSSQDSSGDSRDKHTPRSPPAVPNPEHPINGTVPLHIEGTIPSLIAGHEGIEPDLINRQPSQTPSTVTLEADTSNMSSLGSSFGSDDYSHEYIKQYSSSSKGSKAPRTPTSDDEMCKVSSSSSSSRYLTVDIQVIFAKRNGEFI